MWLICERFLTRLFNDNGYSFHPPLPNKKLPIKKRGRYRTRSDSLLINALARSVFFLETVGWCYTFLSGFLRKLQPSLCNWPVSPCNFLGQKVLFLKRLRSNQGHFPRLIKYIDAVIVYWAADQFRRKLAHTLNCYWFYSKGIVFENVIGPRPTRSCNSHPRRVPLCYRSLYFRICHIILGCWMFYFSLFSLRVFQQRFLIHSDRHRLYPYILSV